MRLNVGLLVSKKGREYLGDELLKEIFSEGELSYAAEYGDYVVNDLRDNDIQALVIVSERENKDISDFLRNIDDLTAINPLSIEHVYLEWLESKEQAKALILAYISKASLSFLAKRVQPVRSKNLSRRSLLRGKLYYYKPYPVLYQEISFEREMNYLSSLCELVTKTPEGPQVSNPETCSACGFCSGMSFLGYLEVPNFTTDQIIAYLNALAKYAPNDKPSVVLITCNKIGKIPQLDGIHIYPLIAPCISSVHDSFLMIIFASGFYPVVFSPDNKCELRDIAKLRAEAMMKKFPGTEINFPYVEDFKELELVLKGISNSQNLERSYIPQDLPLSRSRRRSLMLWSLSEVSKRMVLNEEDEIPGVYEVIVDPNKCVLCGVCVRSCQMLVFDMKNNPETSNLYYDLSYCIGSQRCVRNCPEKAVYVKGFVKIKDLGKKLVVTSRIVKCRYCGKPLDSFRIKSRVGEMLSSLGIQDLEDYTDVCNECKQKILTKRWIEKVLMKK